MDYVQSLTTWDGFKKKLLPAGVSEHFIDEWPKDPENLAESLKEYKNTRPGTKADFTNNKYFLKCFNRDDREIMWNPLHEYSNTK